MTVRRVSKEFRRFDTRHCPPIAFGQLPPRFAGLTTFANRNPFGLLLALVSATVHNALGKVVDRQFTGVESDKYGQAKH